jgi:hypothetical protein
VLWFGLVAGERTADPSTARRDRSASLGMTKGRVVLWFGLVAGGENCSSLVKVCGIPHLAKNERDVGHPRLVAETEVKERAFAFLFGTRPGEQR